MGKHEELARAAYERAYAFPHSFIKEGDNPWAKTDTEVRAEFFAIVDAILAALAEPSFEMVDDACYNAEASDDVYHPESFPGGAQGAHNDFTARWQAALKAV